MFFHCYSQEQSLLILLNHRGFQKLNDAFFKTKLITCFGKTEKHDNNQN